ncbi:ArpU family phage packaging/lysis transcriptional regulator [Listeria costaricensis]|uniref:ArpU family phage packaging/lysis transcriptional regulator n=1 Tax=Listeria costaricensis TaxID=2026604 RepID=UPI000C06CE99|nr:ArpU family phage packaging/lysis transcriptional regulator [Listeria costaricensis]
MEQLLPNVADIQYMPTVRAFKRLIESYQLQRKYEKFDKWPAVLSDYQLADDGCDPFGLGRTINQLDPLFREIIIKSFFYKKQDIAVMYDLPYEIAQFKRLKKKAVIEVAALLEIVVLKQA